MTKYENICKSIDDTKNLAYNFAKLIEKEGCFINLYGEIGAGKTAFVKLVAEAIGVTEKVTSKNGKEYLKVVKEEKMEKRQKDMPSRLNARRKIMKKVNKVEGVDLMDKLFNELAPKYEARVGGYTGILKMDPRKGDNADQAILMLV